MDTNLWCSEGKQVECYVGSIIQWNASPGKKINYSQRAEYSRPGKTCQEVKPDNGNLHYNEIKSGWFTGVQIELRWHRAAGGEVHHVYVVSEFDILVAAAKMLQVIFILHFSWSFAWEHEDKIVTELAKGQKGLHLPRHAFGSTYWLEYSESSCFSIVFFLLFLWIHCFGGYIAPGCQQGFMSK